MVALLACALGSALRAGDGDLASGWGTNGLSGPKEGLRWNAGAGSGARDGVFAAADRDDDRGRPRRPARPLESGPGPTMATSATLTTDLTSPEAVPYFLWDEPLTVAEFRRRLAESSGPERDRLLGKLLREARDPDVWLFVSLEDVRAAWPRVSRHLGRRRRFREFLLDAWARQVSIGGPG